MKMVDFIWSERTSYIVGELVPSDREIVKVII